MYRSLRSSGRRRPLTSQTFATLALVALASVVGVPLLSGASIAASSIPRDERMIVSQVQFDPNVVTSRTQQITIRVRIGDTRGFVVRDATVFVRSTLSVTTGNRLQTATDGWATFQLQPLSTF